MHRLRAELLETMCQDEYLNWLLQWCLASKVENPSGAEAKFTSEDIQVSTQLDPRTANCECAFRCEFL